MPWVKLTDDWYDDPKVINAGDQAAWLWVVGLSWCARNLTDGHIPANQIARLTTLEDPHSAAARAVEADLFRQVDGGFQVVNYLRFQPPRAEVIAKREADAERKRRGRSADRPADVQADSSDRPTPPVPGPGPVDNSSSSSVLPVDRAVFEAVADLRTKKEQAKGKVRSPARWRDKVLENLPAEIGPKVRELNELYDEPAARIAEAVEGMRPTTGFTKRPVAEGAQP